MSRYRGHWWFQFRLFDRFGMSVLESAALVDRFIADCSNKLPPTAIYRLCRYQEWANGDVDVCFEYEVDRDEPVYKDWVAKNTAQQPESGA